VKPQLEVFADPRRLAERAAEVFEGQISYASRERGRVSIALSRPTPSEVFACIGDARLPRRDVDVFQVDERKVEKESTERNLKLVKHELTRWMGAVQLHPMPVDGALSRGADAYEKELIDVCGRRPVIDLVHLGLGPDGHTASLVGGDPVLDVRDRFVAATKKHKGHRRMTLTYPVLDAARLVVFVVTGEEKADALARVLRGDRSMPAARLRSSNVLILADRQAAGRT
jgi:6-phosphogluconolactonase